MNKPIGAIDRDKVVCWAEAEHSSKKGEDGFSVGYRTAMSWVINRVKSGTFPLSDQSEATRLREALERIATYPKGEALVYVSEIKNIAKEALSSSHREDGIQKVRGLYEKYVGSEDAKNRGIALGVKLASEALGISITDGGKPNE